MSGLPELNVDELAVIYSAAILVDDDVSITVDKISALVKAANLDVEPIWPTLYARALNGINVRQLLTNLVAGGRCGAALSSQGLTGGVTSGGLTTDIEQMKASDTATQKNTQDKNEDEEGDDDDDDDLGMNLFDFD